MSAENENNVTRRGFLRQSACAGIGTVGLVNTIANLRLMSAAVAAGPPLTDYKALICLYMSGGNDSDNMVIPFSGAERTLYETHRGVLAHNAGNLQRIYPDNDPVEVGLHPDMPDIAEMFNGGRAAVVRNVGTLLHPFANRTEYLTGAVPAPPSLFAHNTQSTHWMSSVPDQAFTTGWGGRISDMLHASYNTDSSVTMNVSMNGLNNFMTGASSVIGQFAVNPYDPVPELSGFGANYSQAISGTNYVASAQGDRLRAMTDLNNEVRTHLMEEAYAQKFLKARETEGVISSTFTEAAASGVDFNSIFTDANTSLGRQLKTVAQMMAGRNCLGNKRQIFFVRVGGYDTHGSLRERHDPLMEEFNGAMKAFDTAVQGLGLLNNTLLFTASEFGRTFTPNKTDSTGGSDHGWGGNMIVYGGAVKGKNMYGAAPELEPGGNSESNNTRGRWIPTTAVDQYGAVVTKWLGADANSLETIFPNLPRFDDPFTSTNANLKFINFAI